RCRCDDPLRPPPIRRVLARMSSGAPRYAGCVGRACRVRRWFFVPMSVFAVGCGACGGVAPPSRPRAKVIVGATTAEDSARFESVVRTTPSDGDPQVVEMSGVIDFTHHQGDASEKQIASEPSSSTTTTTDDIVGSLSLSVTTLTPSRLLWIGDDSYSDV